MHTDKFFNKKSFLNLNIFHLRWTLKIMAESHFIGSDMIDKLTYDKWKANTQN